MPYLIGSRRIQLRMSLPTDTVLSTKYFALMQCRAPFDPYIWCRHSEQGHLRGGNHVSPVEEFNILSWCRSGRNTETVAGLRLAPYFLIREDLSPS